MIKLALYDSSISAELTPDFSQFDLVFDYDDEYDEGDTPYRVALFEGSNAIVNSWSEQSYGSYLRAFKSVFDHSINSGTMTFPMDDVEVRFIPRSEEIVDVRITIYNYLSIGTTLVTQGLFTTVSKFRTVYRELKVQHAKIKKEQGL